jgi:hypothetical protein
MAGEMTNGMIRKAVKVLQRRGYLDQPILSGIQLALFLIGAAFWMEARLSNDAFNVQIYGEFALRFPAEMWAGAMMGGAAMTWVGLRVPVKRWMVLVGALIMAANFLGLAYSAIATGGELIIGVFCSVLFAPLYVVIAWEAATDDDW